MALIYNVTIEPTGKEGVFHIAWQKKGTNQQDGFNRKTGDITKEEVEQLWQQPYDVVHLSGHAGIDKQGVPYFIMENETGYRRDVSPYELREELSAGLKDPQACHRAAFAYYEEICKDMESIEPVLVEEWIYHALGCGSWQRRTGNCPRPMIRFY